MMTKTYVGTHLSGGFRVMLFTAALILCTGCGKQDVQSTDAPAEVQIGRATDEIIEEMVAYYGNYGEAADARVSELLDELALSDPSDSAKWNEIMDIWKTANSGLMLNYDVLPDGLTDTDELAIVALGFQLAPDGSMRDELIERLNVVKACAGKYPNALVVCTGGPTAAQDPSATEAGKMAEWLVENGVAAGRVIAEDKSLTTAQNAIYSIDILAEQHPQVKELAIVSSDYHIATGVLLFEAEAILRTADDAERMRVISNAAWNAPSGSLSTTFQAGALLELSGDTETAYEIYYNTYDIHELPPLE